MRALYASMRNNCYEMSKENKDTKKKKEEKGAQKSSADKLN